MAKKMMLEDLAGMVQRGFEKTATKQDLAEVKQDLAGVKLELEEHIRDLANDINKIDRKLDGVPSLAEFDELRKRMERVEKKVGLA